MSQTASQTPSPVIGSGGPLQVPGAIGPGLQKQWTGPHGTRSCRSRRGRTRGRSLAEAAQLADGTGIPRCRR